MPEKRPGHPGHFVGHGHGCHLGRPPSDQVIEPGLVCSAAPLGVPDHGHRPGDEQPPQIRISLLGDFAEPLLSTS